MVRRLPSGASGLRGTFRSETSCWRRRSRLRLMSTRRSRWRTGAVRAMNFDWSPAHERAATVAFDKQAASVRLDAWQKAMERKPPDKGTAASLLLRFLYWIYERRLLNQLKQKPMPRHIG